MLADRPSAAPAVLLACCALLQLLSLLAEPIDAQSQSYNTQIQMGILNPDLQTLRTHYVPDGQCSAQILPAQICSGERPLAVRVEVTDGAAYPVLQVLDTLQTVYVFRAAGPSGACAGRAVVRLLHHCP